MKRVLLLTVLVAVLLSMMAGEALAGGWWTSGTSPWDYNLMKPGGSSPRKANWNKDGWNDVELNGGAGFNLNNTYSAFTIADDGDYSPHQGFSTTTNFCKTCHAVHKADGDSWRLLRGTTTVAGQVEQGTWSMGFIGSQANKALEVAPTPYGGAGDYGTYQTAISNGALGANLNRVGECDVCHLGTSSLTYKRQYKLNPASVRAEHTLGYVGDVPDSDLVAADWNTESGEKGIAYGESGAGLQCYTCHTVHGADKLSKGWGAKILRNNPARRPAGQDANTLAVAEATAYQANSGYTPLTAAQIEALNPAFAGRTISDETISGTMATWFGRSMYCRNCHNKNYRGELGTVDTANQASHPTWDDADPMTLEVYGEDKQVAGTSLGFASMATSEWYKTAENNKVKDNRQYLACRQCHRVSSQYSGANGGPSIWPHQGVGYKFLTDSFTDVEGMTDKSGVPIATNEGLDGVCTACHQWNGGASGVGKTF